MKTINQHRTSFIAAWFAAFAIAAFIASAIIFADGKTEIVSDALNAAFANWFLPVVMMAGVVLAVLVSGNKKELK